MRPLVKTVPAATPTLPVLGKRCGTTPMHPEVVPLGSGRSPLCGRKVIGAADVLSRPFRRRRDCCGDDGHLSRRRRDVRAGVL